jgi:restriction endonuclease S subunit
LKKSLKDIVNIKTGLFAKPTDHGEVVYLQSKHFDENGQLAAVLYPDLNKDSIPEQHLLNAGDVLFAAKGTKNFATVYEEKNPIAVASTSFLVISLIVDYIEPKFLAWWLNSKEVQEFLKGIAKGTSIPSITKAQMEELMVPILPLDVQNSLVRLSELRLKEKMILADIERLNEYKLDLSLMKIIQNYE